MVKTEAKKRVQDGAKVEKTKNGVQGEEERRRKRPCIFSVLIAEILFLSLKWTLGHGLPENQHFSLQLL